MKKSVSILMAIVAMVCLTSFSADAKVWNFAAVSAADVENLAADATGWEHESSDSNDRYKNKLNYSSEAITANGHELDFTSGLKATISDADAFRVDIKGKRMAMNKPMQLIIPSLSAGSTVTVKCKTSSKTAARGLNVTNLTPVSGMFNSTSLDDQVNVATVTADGDVILENTGGLYVFSIEVTEGGD